MAQSLVYLSKSSYSSKMAIRSSIAHGAKVQRSKGVLKIGDYYYTQGSKTKDLLVAVSRSVKEYIQHNLYFDWVTITYMKFNLIKKIVYLYLFVLIDLFTTDSIIQIETEALKGDMKIYLYDQNKDVINEVITFLKEDNVIMYSITSFETADRCKLESYVVTDMKNLVSPFYFGGLVVYQEHLFTKDACISYRDISLKKDNVLLEFHLKGNAWDIDALVLKLDNANIKYLFLNPKLIISDATLEYGVMIVVIILLLLLMINIELEKRRKEILCIKCCPILTSPFIKDLS